MMDIPKPREFKVYTQTHTKPKNKKPRAKDEPKPEFKRPDHLTHKPFAHLNELLNGENE